MTTRERRRLAISLGISVAVAIVLSVALWNQWFTTLQTLATDRLLFHSRDQPPSDLADKAKSVVVVAIDDTSVERLGRHGNWPRAHYAALVDRLREGFARGIVFDVGFIEAHADDPEVAAALQRFVNVDVRELQQAGAPLNRRSVISPVIGVPNDQRTTKVGNPHEYPQLLRPVPDYMNASTAFGHANVIPDEDGTVRRTPLLIRVQGEMIPSLALAAAGAYTETLSRGFTLDPDGSGLRALNRYVPIDGYYQGFISFVGPPSRVRNPQSQTFRTISFVEVMEGRVDPAVFRDKMVFIGLLDATGFADDYNVPTSSVRGETVGKMHGVEIHANVFTTLVAARFFTEQQFGVTAGVVWLLALVTGLITFRFSVVGSAVAAFAVGISYILGAFAWITYDWDAMGIAIPNVIYPPLALLLTFIGVIIYRVVFEQAEARATRSAMGKYLSPAILDEVLKDPDRLRLGGEKRVMTALFSDIRGFTSISEKLDPEQLVILLNEYLSVMTDIVHKQQGVLDKYMGDAIMAWWGAPTDQPDHAYRACLTALQMRAELAKLHESWTERDVPKMEMGVGLNTGPMVYGNTGSYERFDFTVLGDAVNLASRLEGVNKEYGSNVIISEATLAEVKQRDFVVRFLDMIEVKGKTEPVGIYELIGTAGSSPPHVPDLLDAWDAAMALYRSRDFVLAERAFRRVLEVVPTDGPAKVYTERCAELREHPPAPDWDGVFVMTHK